MRFLRENRFIAAFLGSALKATFALVIVLWLNQDLTLAADPVTQTQGVVKPTGTAESDMALWLPEGAVSEPFLPTADYIAETALPQGVSYPPNSVGEAFTFGLWVGDGATLTHFTPSIVINMRYEDSDISPAALPDENRLHMMLYNPATQSWAKLCSSVDIHGNVVSAALALATPLDGKGSSLMILAIDPTPPLEQTVDGKGTTTISLKGSNFGFQVLFDTIEVGSHFAITTLPNVVESGPVKLFSRPIDIKACQIDHTNPDQYNRQLTSFPKSLRIGFAYDSDTVSRAGGKNKLTIVNLQNQQWIDEEALGFSVVRGDDMITVDTLTLGTFSMAVR